MITSENLSCYQFPVTHICASENLHTYFDVFVYLYVYTLARGLTSYRNGVLMNILDKVEK